MKIFIYFTIFEVQLFYFFKLKFFNPFCLIDSESSLLSRSVSDPLYEKSSELARKSSKEGKDGRI